MKSFELFVGAGGLALGISDAGFQHLGVIEWDQNACDTIRANQQKQTRYVSEWKLYQTDVKQFIYGKYIGKVDLLAGGPPCQPFSIGGKHHGFLDKRDMFPEMVRAVRETCPKVVLIENVRGLVRKSFSKYFSYILMQIMYPDIKTKDGEGWLEHLSRLERIHLKGEHNGLMYRVIYRVLNAADYGVPQKRERVFIVGVRNDLHMEWSFPRPTHSFEALLHDQWVTGEYWERHEVSKSLRPEITPLIKRKVNIPQSQLFAPDEKPWLTVRDAFYDLPDPELKNGFDTKMNHEFRPGAKKYPGHTGSPLDEPAKTLKAGDHGVPGGENMLLRPDGSVRYFTVRESARLQTFPDEYVFPGSWTESMRQLGNAVPVKLASLLANELRLYLQKVSWQGGYSKEDNLCLINHTIPWKRKI